MVIVEGVLWDGATANADNSGSPCTTILPPATPLSAVVRLCAVEAGPESAFCACVAVLLLGGVICTEYWTLAAVQVIDTYESASTSANVGKASVAK